MASGTRKVSMRMHTSSSSSASYHSHKPHTKSSISHSTHHVAATSIRSSTNHVPAKHCSANTGSKTKSAVTSYSKQQQPTGAKNHTTKKVAEIKKQGSGSAKKVIEAEVIICRVKVYEK